jgi:hypothetical protein
LAAALDGAAEAVKTPIVTQAIFNSLLDRASRARRSRQGRRIFIAEDSALIRKEEDEAGDDEKD